MALRTNDVNKLRMLAVEDVRETNEIRLLHVIRDRQPISRADLVKATGLRAGTVSVIVTGSSGRALFYEGESAPSGRRPSGNLSSSSARRGLRCGGISIGVHNYSLRSQRLQRQNPKSTDCIRDRYRRAVSFSALGEDGFQLS